MEFLSILIVLGLVQLWGSGGPVQRDEWFWRWAGYVIGLVGGGRLRLIVLVGGPVVLVLFLHAVLYSVLFGLLSLVLFVLVLLYSLGRGDYSEAVQKYLFAWNNGDFESAYDKALSIGDFQQSNTIGDHVALHDHVRSALVYEGYQRWFAVVFWFLILGPCGALGYRLSYLSARSHRLEDSERQLALRWVHYLDWIPARLLALSFALTGNFISGANRSWQYLLDNMPISELLEQSARGAINSDDTPADTDAERFIVAAGDELTSLQSLISRSVIAWIIILAVLTMAAA